jgi:hypothetical protein
MGRFEVAAGPEGDAEKAGSPRPHHVVVFESQLHSPLCVLDRGGHIPSNLCQRCPVHLDVPPEPSQFTLIVDSGSGRRDDPSLGVVQAALNSSKLSAQQ